MEAIDIIETEETTEFAEGIALLESFFTPAESPVEGVSLFVPLPNIAHLIDEDTLAKVGHAVINGFDADWNSMEGWRDYVDVGRELVKQEKESRSTPWDGASNFKSPTLMNAALKFSDRASTELLRQRDIVKTTVVGDDDEGIKGERADRVATYMNHQVNTEMEGWREEHEKLIYDIPYAGTEFKKTFFDSRLGRNDSVLVTYPNFAVNQAAQSMERLRRFSEIIDLSENEVMERQAQGLWLNPQLDPKKKETGVSEEGETSVEEQADDDKYSQFIEQQGFYDLDGDGYQEPYTFVVHKNSGQVMRIVPRFEVEGILVKSGARAVSVGEVGFIDAEIVRIKPDRNITKYGFIRDPDGGFLDVGFNYLLGALTASINSTTNQLVDSGTLANRAGSTGWLAKGFRKKMGESAFRMGEYKQTNLSAQDLQNGIKSLPIGQPSVVLFQLMQMMVANSQELSASTDLSTSLGANAPATTTLALVQEQQAFTGAIILRLYRAMSVEFKKMFVLNAKFLDPEDYKNILDDEEADFEQDFNLKDVDVVPVANPEISSKIQRLQLAEVEMSRLNEIAAAGGDPRPVIKNFLEQIGTTNIDEILPDAEPEQQLMELVQRNPQLIELITNEQQRAEMQMQLEQQAIQAEATRKDAETASKIEKETSETEKNKVITLKTQAEIASDQASKTASIQSDIIKLDQTQQGLDLKQVDQINTFALKLTELEQKVGEQLNNEVEENTLTYDPETDKFVRQENV